MFQGRDSRIQGRWIGKEYFAHSHQRINGGFGLFRSLRREIGFTCLLRNKIAVYALRPPSE